MSKERPQKFTAPAAEWWRTIGFFLCLALAGLEFYPALILVALYLVQRFRTDRYSFLIELMILFGCYGFVSANILPVKLSDFAFVVSMVALLVMRRTPVTNRTLWLTLAYFAAIAMIASTSDESMRIQVVMMRNYFFIIAFAIPLLVFANRPFEMDKFIHSVFVHVLVICGFYVVDTFIIHGTVLVPRATFSLDHMGQKVFSSIHHILAHPLQLTYFPRHYPTALFWMVICILPIVEKKVRLSFWQWVLVIFTFFSTRTMSFLGGLLVCFICFRRNVKQQLAVGLGSIVLIVGLYFADSAMGSPLRIASTIDQFTSLEAAADNEDLAEFGSGRMAQILPKWELLGQLDRYWLGFGFLHPQLTTNPKYQIKNEYYTDVSQSDELATAVEVTQVQTILDVGFLGLIVQTAFYIALWFVLRRQHYARFYLCAIVAFSVFGIGGFSGLNQREGLLIIATVVGAILAANKPASLELEEQKALNSNPSNEEVRQ